MPEAVRFLPTTYVAAHAADRPQAPAVIDPDRTLTFADLDREARRAADAIRASGVRAGDVVAVQLPNAWEYVVLELAIPLLTAIVLPLPLNLGEFELERALSGSGAKLLITAGLPDNAAANRIAAGLGVDVSLARDLLDDAASELAVDEPAPDPDRIVEIALTSGTTGMPKLAALSAGLKQATFEGFTERLEITPDDRVLPMSPLMQGIGGMCLLCVRAGAALVMLREPRFSAEATLRMAAATSSSVLVGVPTNVIRMLESPLAAAALSSCRCTAVAGAPMPPDASQAWEAQTGARVVSFYGSMDAGQLAVGRPSDPPEKRWFTVGRPHDSCQCMICDAGGQPVPPGEVGEVCMRGPTVQERYWGETRGPLASDGWAHMGDLGRLDADGYLQVVGRVKDILIRGGTNINPYEVEAAIRAHPAIRDVCVVGRPDTVLGERPMAFVVGEVTLDALRTHLAARGIAKYKWPEFLETVDEIPLSGPGKVNRKLLKERASAESSLP